MVGEEDGGDGLVGLGLARDGFAFAHAAIRSDFEAVAIRSFAGAAAAGVDLVAVAVGLAAVGAGLGAGALLPPEELELEEPDEGVTLTCCPDLF